MIIITSDKKTERANTMFDIISETMCEYPGKPRHGEVSGDFPAKFRSVATFSCKPGYQLEGSDAVVCLADGRWSNTRPQCKRKYHFHIPFLGVYIS